MEYARPHSRRLTEWAVLCTAAIALMLALQFGSVSSLAGDVLFDVAQGRAIPAPSADIVVVNIDNDSLDKLGGWPLPRARYTALLNLLRNSGTHPRAIGFDLLFLEARQGDASLARAMQDFRVVLPVELRPGSQGSDKVLIPVVRSSHTRLAHIDILPDRDGRVRQVSPQRDGYPQFAYALAGISAADTAQAPVRFARIAQDRAFPTIALADLLDNPHSAQQLDNKYVLVGATAVSLGDLYPVSGMDGTTHFMPGILLHANILNSLLQGRNISLAGPWLNFACSLPLLLAFMLGLLRLSADRKELAASVGVLLLTLTSCGLGLWWARFWVNPAGLIMTMLLVRPAWSWLRMRQLVNQLQGELAEAQHHLPPTALLARQASRPRWDGGDELAEGIERLSDQTDFLQRIINYLPEAVFIFSPDRELALWLSNARARAILDHLQPEKNSNLRQLIGQFGGQYDHNGRLRLDSLPQRWSQTKDNMTSHYQLQAHLVDEQNRHEWLILSLTDITDTIRAQQQRERSMQLLSHDMRTPVITILTISQQARAEQRLSETNYLNITESADLLLSFMDDFILSIKAEQEHYQTHETLLSELLTEAWAKIQPLATRLGMTMDAIEDEAMLFIDVDHRLMLRVFINLLFNAVNHGQEDGHISIHIQRQNDADAVVRITNRKSTSGGNCTRHAGYGLGNDFIDSVVHRHGGKVLRHFPCPAQPETTVWVEIWLPTC